MARKISPKKVENIIKRLARISADMEVAFDGIRASDYQTEKGQRMLALVLRQTKRQLQKLVVRM